MALRKYRVCMTAMEKEENDPRLLKTVNITCEILQALKDVDQAGVTELAEKLDLSKGAVYNHLATLRENGFITKEGDHYQLGLRFVNYGACVKNQSIVLQEGKEESDNLAMKTGEYVHLLEMNHKEGVFVYIKKGENAVGDEYYSQIQEETDPLYCTAAGKAALAFMPDERINTILRERTLDPHTKHTITDPDELRKELSQIREQGFALNDEEEFLGLRAVGAPIRDRNNQVLGSISVSGPVSRLSGKRFKTEIPETVMEVSNIIEINIKQRQALSE